MFYFFFHFFILKQYSQHLQYSGSDLKKKTDELLSNKIILNWYIIIWNFLTFKTHITFSYHFSSCLHQRKVDKTLHYPVFFLFFNFFFVLSRMLTLFYFIKHSRLSTTFKSLIRLAFTKIGNTRWWRNCRAIGEFIKVPC